MIHAAPVLFVKKVNQPFFLIYLDLHTLISKCLSPFLQCTMKATLKMWKREQSKWYSIHSKKSDFRSFKSDFHSFKSDFRSFKSDFHSFKNDFRSFKSDFHSFKSDFCSFKSDFHSFKSDFTLSRVISLFQEWFHSFKSDFTSSSERIKFLLLKELNWGQHIFEWEWKVIDFHSFGVIFTFFPFEWFFFFFLSEWSITYFIHSFTFRE